MGTLIAYCEQAYSDALTKIGIKRIVTAVAENPCVKVWTSAPPPQDSKAPKQGKDRKSDAPETNPSQAPVIPLVL
jgi:hypothetical protein